MNSHWTLIRLTAMRDDAGNVRRVTAIWENADTLEERTVHYSGLDLRYIAEVA